MVEFSVIDPQGTVRRRFSGRRCAHNGLARLDEPIAVNARTGAWTVTAFEGVTAMQFKAQVRVE